jgi:Prenyltransferase and squalene oxidase repeat
MTLLKIAESLNYSVQQAHNFLIEQLSETRPGWGSEPSADLDPWTTGQIAFLLSQAEYTDHIFRALGWLADAQNPNGSWGSNAYGNIGDTPSTSCCTIAFLHHFGNSSSVAQRGLQWLGQNYNRGWTTQPTDTDKKFLPLHLYSTPYALRALARAPKLPMHSLCLQEAIAILSRTQVANAGWGFQHDSAADSTYTSYVLHGLIDVVCIWGIKVPDDSLLNALNWLLSEQNNDGSWSDWHGIKSSPEATGYAIYVLLSAGLCSEHPNVILAAEWLLSTQTDEGAWCLGLGSSDRPNNWVTYSVAKGLTALLNTLTSQDEAHQISNSAGLNTLRLKNLDSEPLSSRAFVRTFSITSPDLGIPSISDEDLKSLYVTQLQMQWTNLPHTRPLDHTMFEALDQYVAQKLPEDDIKNALLGETEIEIHGIYPDHFKSIASMFSWDDISEITFNHKQSENLFNVKRPRFFYVHREDGTQILIVAVIPGKDYVLHYASLIRHIAYFHTKHAEQHIRIFRYPYVEKFLAKWTKLNIEMIVSGDRILLGHVSLVREHLNELNDVRFESFRENDFYGSYRYVLPDGSTLNLLGVKYCFWGSISSQLVTSLCELGASEIIYLAKLGSLSAPADIYNRIFCPSKFVVMNHDQVVYTIENLPNGILQFFPNLDSACHVSVPTVLEEDYDQRKVTIDLNAQSIDNEIAQMAQAVSVFNRGKNAKILFSALHFATDYVRSPQDRIITVPFDLRNNRTAEAQEAKGKIIKKICQSVLFPYLKKHE